MRASELNLTSRNAVHKVNLIQTTRQQALAFSRLRLLIYRFNNPNMNCILNAQKRLKPILGLALAAGFTHLTQAQDLSVGLVSYWPLDEIQGTKTPDLVSGYDLDLNNLTAADLVTGVRGKAFSFSNARKTMLSRVHKAGEALPINQHAAFTVSFWAKVAGTGQNDLRLFSEGNTGNSDPLFNLGTHNVDGTLDLFIRQSGTTTVNHLVTVNQPLDDTWHQIVYVQDSTGSRTIYIDGVADDLVIPAKEALNLNVNDTTIGGILRASPGSWMTGLIDDVALWKRALTQAEITKLNKEGLTSVFSPIANGLVSHWPLDVVQGTKTPDVVSGYDLDLNNLTAGDLVTGKIGKAFNFSNAKKTLLTRVHKAGEGLPINQHPAFTISFWAKVPGIGQNDLRLFSEGNTGNSDPLFNLGTHNVDGTLDLFIRQSGTTTVNHLVTVNQPLDDTWRHILYVQETDGSRKIYIDGVADDLVIPAKEPLNLNVNDTSVGGILRASPGSWVTGLIDDVALWKRGLTPAEIGSVYSNGVPNVFTKKLPLDIRSFTADFAAASKGDKVTLRWQASADATLTISGGVGDVTAKSQFGAGSAEATINETTTFSLIASRTGESITSLVTVASIPNVSPNWRALENFNSLTPGPIGGKGNWSNPEGEVRVANLIANSVMGVVDGNDLAALPLRSLTIPEGKKTTLFFRMWVAPDDGFPSIILTLGLTDRPIRFNGDFNSSVGPYIRIERFAGEGNTIDLQAHNGVGAVYDVVSDVIQPGKIYNVWIDVENRAFDPGDLYSVFIQKEGDAARTTLFQDYISDRDGVNIDPFFGAPSTNLTHLFISSMGASQGITNILFDDFFLSANGYNNTVPVPASPFVVTELPKEIKVLSSSYATGSKSFTLSWSSSSGIAYDVQRKTKLTDPWLSLSPRVNATGASSTFTDPTASQVTAYYRIVSVP